MNKYSENSENIKYKSDFFFVGPMIVIMIGLLSDRN